MICVLRICWDDHDHIQVCPVPLYRMYTVADSIVFPPFPPPNRMGHSSGGWDAEEGRWHPTATYHHCLLAEGSSLVSSDATFQVIFSGT